MYRKGFKADTTVVGIFAHHDPVRPVHVFKEVAGVGGNRACPRTPQQRKQPALINHPQVHFDILAPLFPVRYEHRILKWDILYNRWKFMMQVNEGGSDIL